VIALADEIHKILNLGEAIGRQGVDLLDQGLISGH
jgi:hypothetical protein